MKFLLLVIALGLLSVSVEARRRRGFFPAPPAPRSLPERFNPIAQLRGVAERVKNHARGVAERVRGKFRGIGNKVGGKFKSIGKRILGKLNPLNKFKKIGRFFGRLFGRRRRRRNSRRVGGGGRRRRRRGGRRRRRVSRRRRRVNRRRRITLPIVGVVAGVVLVNTKKCRRVVGRVRKASRVVKRARNTLRRCRSRKCKRRARRVLKKCNRTIRRAARRCGGTTPVVINKKKHCGIRAVRVVRRARKFRGVVKRARRTLRRCRSRKCKRRARRVLKKCTRTIRRAQRIAQRCEPNVVKIKCRHPGRVVRRTRKALRVVKRARRSLRVCRSRKCKRRARRVVKKCKRAIRRARRYARKCGYNGTTRRPTTTKAPVPTRDPCMRVRDVKSCTSHCATNPKRKCKSYCIAKSRGLLRKHSSRRCGRICRKSPRDRCVDQCVQSKEVFNGCLTPAPTTTTARPTKAPRVSCRHLRRNLKRCRGRKHCVRRARRALRKNRCRVPVVKKRASCRTLIRRLRGCASRRNNSRGRCLHRVRRQMRRRNCRIPTPPRHSCKKLRRQMSHCRHHTCRAAVRALLKAGRCPGIRTIRIVTQAPRSCATLRRRARSCRHHACRKAYRKLLRQSNCRRTTTRRRTTRKRTTKRVATSKPKRVPCSKKRYRLHVKTLRRHLHQAQQAAQLCGDVDEACVDKAYRKIAIHRSMLSRFKLTWKGRCGGSVRKNPCGRSTFNSWLRRMRGERALLQKESAACDADDKSCVARTLRKLVRINRRINRRGRRCKRRVHVSKALRPKPSAIVKCGTWIHMSHFRKAVTCDSLKTRFQRWLRFTTCRRKRLHQQANRCDSSNVFCLRHQYKAIVRVQKKIRKARDEYARLITICDRCAPIKMRFQRWVRRQRARRHRLHLQACSCVAGDVECIQENVDAIKTIQNRIALRRAQVLSLHRDCSARASVDHDGITLVHSTKPFIVPSITYTLVPTERPFFPQEQRVPLVPVNGRVTAVQANAIRPFEPSKSKPTY